MLIAFGAGFHNAQGVYFLILGCLAIVFSLVSEPSQRMLSSRPFVFLGKISFGLYLIHIPIICSFSCWAFLAISPSLGPNLTALLVSALTFVASIALGYGLYVVADRPALGLSRRLSAFMANPFAPEFKRPGAKGQSYGAGPGGGAGMGHVRAGS